MKHLPPLNYIRSFEASARHLSFTRAADELGLTQAAVSMHVKGLEAFIGRPLFHRSPRSLVLTDVAAAYLPGLRAALTQLDATTAHILTVPHRQQVIVACPASLATNWLPSRLKLFSRLYPEIEITVHATIWAEKSDAVADIRIVPRSDDQQLVGHSLGRERLAMVCSPSFLVGDNAIHHVADIAKLGLIHVLGREDHWEDFGRHHGIGHLHLLNGHRADSSNVALEMATAGMGCAINLYSLVENHIQRGLLVEPFPANIPSKWSYDIRHGELRPSRAASKLIEFLLTKHGEEGGGTADTKGSPEDELP